MVEKAYQRINSFLTTAKKLAGSLVLLSVFLNCGTARAISLISDEETEIFLHQTLRPVFNAAGVAFRPGQIYIVNDRELNAFVTDGNRMFVNIGTITAADSQNELTGVLAHETGHIQGGHILRHKIKSREVQSISLASMLVGGLAGIAAGLKSLETGNNNVGYVAAYGRQYAETASGINGFALGVQAVNPDATVYVKELGAWADEVNEGAFAEELIQSFNCGVISQHCDSAQPQIAAQDLGVFGCGYNSDMTADAPQAHLTAAIWNWNVYYHTAIEAAMTCGGAENFVTAMGGPAYYGGLAEGFVDVSPLNEATVAPGTAEAIEAVRELIVSGEWDVFSGTKLHITVNDDGTVTVDQEDADLLCDGYEYDTTSGTLVERDPVIVAAGGASAQEIVELDDALWARLD